MLKPAYVQGDGLDILVGMWMLFGLTMQKINKTWIAFNGSAILKKLSFQYKWADAV